MISKHFARYLIGAIGLLLIACLAVIAQPSQNAIASDVIPADKFAVDKAPKGIIYVDVEATGTGDGSSWEDAFTGLQPALEAAISGDEIWVAAGVYTPTVAHDGVGTRFYSFQLENGVALYGGFDPTLGDIGFEDRDWLANVTELSGDLGVQDEIADNSYHVFYHPDELTLDASAILDGFTVRGGNADQIGWPHFAGGGMYNEEASPTVRNCTFAENTAYQYGGGMYNYYGSPTVTDCFFIYNSADIAGGIYNDHNSSAISGCIFHNNTAGYGGAMDNYYFTGTLTGCRFENNTADGQGVASDGGAIYNQTSSPMITDCIFTGNSALRDGGGIFNDDSSPVLTDVAFTGNSATYSGGGMYNRDSSSPRLINTLFSNNAAGYYGGGVYSQNSSTPALTNCTFSGNSAEIYNGGAVYAYFGASTILVNSILWGDSPDEISSYDLASAPVVTHSDIQGGYEGDGNINLDPRFVDATIGDYHLGVFSPCIDSGDNLAPDLPAFDFEGDDRLIDGNGDGTATVDMGMDESLGGQLFFRFYLPALLNNY